MSTNIEFTEDLASVTVTFFVAHRPHEDLELAFEQFSADGANLPAWQVTSLPGNQGMAIELGRFEAEHECQLGWSFRTGGAVPGGEVVIGYFPNGKMTKAVRFKHFTVEPFQKYSGVDPITPKLP